MNTELLCVEEGENELLTRSRMLKFSTVYFLIKVSYHKFTSLEILAPSLFETVSRMFESMVADHA